MIAGEQTTTVRQPRTAEGNWPIQRQAATGVLASDFCTMLGLVFIGLCSSEGGACVSPILEDKSGLILAKAALFVVYPGDKLARSHF